MPTHNEETITIKQFRDAIKKLPEDEPRPREGIWYRTQKEHWLGWLKEYNSPGAYNRTGWDRNAKFAYNHVVCSGLLIYLIKAIPLSAETIQKAEEAYKLQTSEMAKAGAIRKILPWKVIYDALWNDTDHGFISNVRKLINREEN